MKANELREGNWVMSDSNKEYRIGLSDFADWYWDHNSHEFGQHIHPIPLTEEWLIKFGFESDDKDFFNKDGFDFDLTRHGERWVLAHYDNEAHSSCSFFAHDLIQNVHQLQNLFYALTGEELTIK